MCKWWRDTNERTLLQLSPPTSFLKRELKVCEISWANAVEKQLWNPFGQIYGRIPHRGYSSTSLRRVGGKQATRWTVQQVKVYGNNQRGNHIAHGARREEMTQTRELHVPYQDNSKALLSPSHKIYHRRLCHSGRIVCQSAHNLRSGRHRLGIFPPISSLKIEFILVFFSLYDFPLTQEYFNNTTTGQIYGGGSQTELYGNQQSLHGCWRRQRERGLKHIDGIGKSLPAYYAAQNPIHMV